VQRSPDPRSRAGWVLEQSGPKAGRNREEHVGYGLDADQRYAELRAGAAKHLGRAITRAFAHEAFAPAVRPLRVLYGNRGHARHAAMAKEGVITVLDAKRARAAARLRTSAAHASWEEIKLATWSR
jgi:hypothetical protein